MNSMGIRTAHFAPNLIDAETSRTVVVDYLRELRGSKPSQRALSRQLGYASNIVYQWESGRRVPSVEHAMKVAEKLARGERKRDFARTMMSREAITEIVQGLLRGDCFDRALERVDVSRHVANRWRDGEATPDFAQFLALQDALAGLALDFLSRLVDPADLPSTREEWNRRQELRAVLRAVPKAGRILTALELEDYRNTEGHDDAWLAARIGLGPGEVHAVLEQLRMAGFVQFEEDHYRSVLEEVELCGALPSNADDESTFVGALSEDQCRDLKRASDEYMTRVIEIINRRAAPKTTLVEVTLSLRSSSVAEVS